MTVDPLARRYQNPKRCIIEGLTLGQAFLICDLLHQMAGDVPHRYPERHRLINAVANSAAMRITEVKDG